jgi:RNA-directed DNA polymerase
VILVDGERRPEWLLTGIDRRLREEFAKLGLALNEAKSRVVDLVKGESFGFLGFDFRRVRSVRGRWRPQRTPKAKKLTGLLRELNEVFRRWRSQPAEKVIEVITRSCAGG